MIEKIKNVGLASFYLGVATSVCLLSIYQSAIGKDAYLQELSTNWVEWWWSVPVALVVMILMLFSLWCNWRLAKKEVAELKAKGLFQAVKRQFEIMRVREEHGCELNDVAWIEYSGDETISFSAVCTKCRYTIFVVSVRARADHAQHVF